MILKKLKNLNSKDYIWIAFLFVLSIWLVPSFVELVIRLYNSVKMFFVNILIYIKFVFLGIDAEGIITTKSILDLGSSTPSNPEIEEVIPISFDVVSIQFVNVLKLPFNKLIIKLYFSEILNLLVLILRLVLIFVMLFLVVKILLNNYFAYHEFNEKEIFKESKEKKAYLKITSLLKKYLINPIKEFVIYSKNKIYWKIGLTIICYKLKIISLLIESISFILAFVVSYDLVKLWEQMVAIISDLWPVLKNIPIIMYLIIFILLKMKKCIEDADDEVRHQHLILKGIVKNEMTTTNFVVGPPSSGKDLLCTQCALIAESNLRYDLKNILIDIRSEYPEFNFVCFEQKIQLLIIERKIVNWRQCEKYVEDNPEEFMNEYLGEKEYHYNELSNKHIIKALSEYAHAYFMYIQDSVLVASNYAIRFDNLQINTGHFIEYDDDFLSHDNRFEEEYSSYSHIVNFDWFRVYKKVINDEFASLEDGCILVLTEYAKERLNQNELKYISLKDEEANQLNDGTNIWWKTKTHENVIRNKRYGQAFINDQRDQSLNADNREIFEYQWKIISKSEDVIVLKGFWFSRVVLDSISKFFRIELEKLMSVRSDDSLLYYLIKKINSFTYSLQERIINRWGIHYLTIENQYQKRIKVPLIHKLIYSNRYNTGTFGSLYIEQMEINKEGMIDYPTYKSTLATKEELEIQRSYFIERFYKENEESKGEEIDENLGF